MVKVDKIIPGGQALGTLDDGKKIFFWNALPGEIISEYEVTKNKSRYVEAIATEIKNPSLFRVKPLDDCFLSTSPWQDRYWCPFRKVQSLKPGGGSGPVPRSCSCPACRRSPRPCTRRRTWKAAPPGKPSGRSPSRW